MSVLKTIIILSIKISFFLLYMKMNSKLYIENYTQIKILMQSSLY